MKRRRSQVIHLRHFYDGYPLCWTYDQDGAFEGSYLDAEVTWPGLPRMDGRKKRLANGDDVGHPRRMTDRLHDHLTLGPRPGCVACAQVEADLALSGRALYAETSGTNG